MLDNPSPSTDATPAGDALSWQERELVGALKRLANARSQYASLKEESEAAKAHAIDPADIAALDATRAELEQMRPKARARFGGAAARDRVHELENTHRLILERMGFATYSEFIEWKNTPSTVSSVDPAILHFAQRELDEAEAAWMQIQSLEIPEPEPEVEIVEDVEDDPPLRFIPPAAS